MRTSKAQQALLRRQILDSAVSLMSAESFEAVTMKQIARAAGIGDATIYKYFPSKERLLLGYFETAVQDAVAQWQATPGQNDFSLQERLQLLVDSWLERLLPQRAFVALSRAVLQKAPLLMLGEALPGKRLLQTTVEQILSQAEDRGEIAPCAYKAACAALMADYCYGVADYWLRDESEHQGQTTQLIDLSLEILVLVLHTGLINKLLALGGFLLRSQMARWMEQGPGLLQALQLVRQGLKGGAA